MRIGSEFAKLLNIPPDPELRFWHRPSSQTPVAFTEIWSTQGDEKHKRYRHGHRMREKLDHPKELCAVAGKSLLFCVDIQRSFPDSTHYEENISANSPPSFKILIFSEDGILA